MRQGATAATALTMFCAALLGPAAVAVAKESPRREVRDLHYGDVLFQFFQDDYFDAVVRLEAARDFGRLPNHAAEAEMLAGGISRSGEWVSRPLGKLCPRCKRTLKNP